jgi:hypothetical protein
MLYGVPAIQVGGQAMILLGTLPLLARTNSKMPEYYIPTGVVANITEPTHSSGLISSYSSWQGAFGSHRMVSEAFLFDHPSS